MKVAACLMVMCGLGAAMAGAQAQPLPKEARVRSAAVEGIYNEHARFVIRVDVDHPNRIYMEGDTLQATVVSERPGYLYLLYLNAEGKTSCLFPNRYQADNRIPAKQAVQVPGPGANFRIRIQRPVGREVLKAVVATRPLSAEELRVESLNEGVATPLSEMGVRAAVVELNSATPTCDWAEHQVELLTVAREASPTPFPPPAPKPRARYAAIVAVGRYKDPHIRPLPACAKDAELMKQLFQTYGRMEDLVVLQDDQATRKNVEKLFRILAEGTKPGDEIFIYWTGHGASVADTDGDEQDGLDEVLVTHDASRDDVGRTGVLDDVLRRWVQDLDGRRVIFMLDVCLAGGFAGTGKGLSDSDKSLFGPLKGEGQPAGAPPAASRFDFFDTEWAQTKDIGQRETAVLCASGEGEVAMVRLDGNCSVMTGFLVDFVSGSPPPVSLRDTYDHVRVKVPEYLCQHGQPTQNPQYLDNLSSPAYLKF